MSKSELLLKLVPELAPPLIRLYMGTIRARWLDIEPCDPPVGLRTPFIYAFWHQRLLLFAETHRFQGITILISRHRDGELIAKTVERLGFQAVRGSTTRGGWKALKEMASKPLRDLAITPDGPRGPRHRLKKGAIHLAAATGCPVIPATCAFERFWQLNSWDGFIIPKPFTRALVRIAPPFSVPADPGASLESYRERLEHIMRKLTFDTDRDLDKLWPKARPQPPYSLRVPRACTGSGF